MLTIIDGGSLARALKLPIDPSLKRLLSERRDQLGGDITNQARFLVMQPGDSLNALEQELGFSVFQNHADGRRFGDPDFSPSWEHLEWHDFGWEVYFIFTDDGFAHVVLTPNAAGVDAELTALFSQFASGQP